jgi:hypothetical protein
MSKAQVSEWMWRFLALVMLFAVGWTMWIFYQLNPPPLITDAAFQAAAAAKASSKQSVEGVITPAAGEPPKPEPVAAKEPPVNTDKLRLSDTLSPPAATPAK